MSERRILLGVVGRPHGVRGLLHVHSYTADPRDLSEYGPLLDEQGRGWTLEWRGDGVAALRDSAGQGLADRTAAEKLTNLRLFVDRSRLPPAGEEEFYLSDLVGLDAVGPAGEALGKVAVVHDYGAGPSLEIARGGAVPLPPLLVPFTRACVPDVDLLARRVVVVPPAEIEARP